jgi:hypothetical protein
MDMTGPHHSETYDPVRDGIGQNDRALRRALARPAIRKLIEDSPRGYEIA